MAIEDPLDPKRVCSLLVTKQSEVPPRELDDRALETAAVVGELVTVDAAGAGGAG